MKIQAINSNYFRDKSHFEDDATRNDLVFQPVYRCFKKNGNSKRISACKSIGWSDENINIGRNKNVLGH